MSQEELKVTSATDVVQTLRKYDMNVVLPAFWNAACILAAVPATSCSVERSFSGLRRTKTYLRSTMGQDRLNNLAFLNIERSFTNKVTQLQMHDIIDAFGRRKNRASLLF